MASQQEVKEYLAYWFQLGKKLILNQKNRQQLLPQSIFQGNRYSQEFETAWHQVMKAEGENWYLEGTPQTVAQLLSADWEIANCSRCNMPIAIINLGIQPEGCPCSDLPNWPNFELPQPRLAINNHQHLSNLQQRLQEKSL